MQLFEAIFLAGQMPEGSVVCARPPFLNGSDAIITQLTPTFGIPDEVKATSLYTTSGRRARCRKSRLHSMSCGSPCKLGCFRVYSRLLDTSIGDRIDALGSNGV